MTPTGSGSGSGSSAGAPIKPLPKVAGDTQGFVIASSQGGSVDATGADDKKFAIPDGTVVDKTAPAKDSMTEDYTWVKTPDGKVGAIEVVHLVMADAIKPDPKLPDYFVLTTSAGCGDYCHQSVWLAHGLAERWNVVHDVVAGVQLWSADGKQLVADDDGNTYVFDVATGKQVKKYEGYIRPALAPDGTLYLRNADFGIFKVDAKTDQVVLVKQGTKPKPEGEDYPQPPEPVQFDKDGKPAAIE